MLRFLQLCAVGFAAWFIVYSKSYLRQSPITPFGVQVWSTSAGVAENMAENVKHCELSADDYTSGKAGAFSKPSACRWLPDGEAHATIADGIFISTANEDRYQREARGEMACAQLAASCQGVGAAMDPDEAPYTRADGSCSCTEADDFFTRNPEKRKLYLHHGYEVLLDSSGKKMQRGVSWMQTATLKNGDERTQIDQPIRTTITDWEGNPCELGDTAPSEIAGSGAKSVWTAAEVAGGIGGTLSQWLACAGVDLDEHAEEIAPDEEGVKLRRTGFHLDLEITTRAEKGSTKEWPTVESTIRVAARTGDMNSVQTLAYTKMYRPSSGEGEYRARKTFGISVHVIATGQFGCFDWAAMITALVNCMVIAQLPNKAVMVLALYCLGLLSKIYYAAQSQRLNITAQFHGAVARYMMATQAFRGLTGQSKIEHGMTYSELSKHMKIVFDKQLSHNGGDIETDELQKMVRMVMWGMDRPEQGERFDEDGNPLQLEDGNINNDEFIRACGCNEVIRMGQIANFFDDERKASCLEYLFDDTQRDTPPREDGSPDFVEAMDAVIL
jgi:hypothetical protein